MVNVEKFAGDVATATQLLVGVGVMDVLIASIILENRLGSGALGGNLGLLDSFYANPAVVRGSIWDFVERWVNWAAPLALLLLVS